MKTEIYKIDSHHNSEDIQKVAEILKNGGIAAIPTETVYGLAANALDKNAVNKIFEAKGRPNDNPLIVHISSLEEAYPLVRDFPDNAKALADAFWPGPLTVILPKSELVPQEVSPRLDTVAIRMPSHPVARAIIKSAGVPLAAPSANLSGSPSPTKACHVIEDLQGRVDAVVDGGDCTVGLESTVITLATNPPTLLRPGGITPIQLEQVLGKIEIDKAVLEKLEEDAIAASPGMKYKHYSPRAEVYIIKGSFESFCLYVDANAQNDDFALCFNGEEEKLKINSLPYGEEESPTQQAHNLFSLLREVDKKGAGRVFVRCPNICGVGLAVYNRLIRAAAFRVINMPEIYGLTGQTGAGKTTIGNALKEKGWQIIDCDKIARQVVEKGSSVLRKLTEFFGEDIVFDDGSLNRALLAKRAFSTPEGEKALNAITHPAITKVVRDEVLRDKDKYPVFVLDAAMLAQSELWQYCSKTIVVTANEITRLNRIVKRDNISPDAAQMRIKAQPNEQYYKSIADVVIENNGGEISLADIF